MLKGAIFDLDGVIVNTVPIHFKAWKKMFAEYGKEFDFDDYKKKVDGIPRWDGAKAILTDLPEDRLREACDRKQKYFLEFLKQEEIEVYPTTVKLIEELKSKGIKVAAASSSKNCPYILKKIGLYEIFDAEVNGNDIKKGKPDPELFLIAAERINIAPPDCAVFEDAKLGVEAAKNGKMFCVGIDRHERPELLKEADLLVKDLQEVNFDKLKELCKRG